MLIKIIHWVGIVSIISLIVVCFIPWTHYNSINETFTGFHVNRFTTGNYYGKAGIPITVFASVILLLMLVPKTWAKRINLFVAAVLFAYAIRTYIIFGSALFEGEVVKLPGIYLVVVLSFIILVSTLFPKVEIGKTDEN